MPKKMLKTRHDSHSPLKETDLRQVYHTATDIRGTGKRGTRRVMNHKRARGFITNMKLFALQRALENAQLLQKNGIFVPRISRVDYQNGLVVFEAGGKSLAEFLAKHPTRITVSQKKQRRRQEQILVAKVFRMLGKVHALGIQHVHPHPRNVLVHGNKVGLIDFKYAVKISHTIWKRPAKKIFQLSEQDYYWVTEPLWRQFGGIFEPSQMNAFQAQWIKQKMFERMVNQYPCSTKTKKELVKLLMAKHGR